jgi:hypothetical protein
LGRWAITALSKVGPRTHLTLACGTERVERGTFMGRPEGKCFAYFVKGFAWLLFMPVAAPFSCAAVKTPVDASYKLIFYEEFTADALRTDRWTPNWLGCPKCITPPVNVSREFAAYDPAQVRVSNGKLRLRVKSSPVTINSRTYPYRSGMVQSHGKMEFTYGYFEARIRLPASGVTNKIANWPAWWIDGHKWPTDGEVDVVEGLEGAACYHFHSSAGSPGGCSAKTFTGWHVYGALWEPGKLTYYYDGKVVGTIDRGVTSSPMYLILNYAVGSYGGAIRVPTHMAVDYVHVYSNRPNARAVTPGPGYGGPGDTGGAPGDVDS